MAALSAWLGGAELRVGHTYLPGNHWSDIEGAPGLLDVWADWRTEKSDRMLVLNVPMQEHNEDGVSDFQGGGGCSSRARPVSSISTSGTSPGGWST